VPRMTGKNGRAQKRNAPRDAQLTILRMDRASISGNPFSFPPVTSPGSPWFIATDEGVWIEFRTVHRRIRWNRSYRRILVRGRRIVVVQLDSAPWELNTGVADTNAIVNEI